MATLTPEQIAAWNRVSPETVIGSPSASWQPERDSEASEVLDDMSL
jgi:hypothetical protein